MDETGLKFRWDGVPTALRQLAWAEAPMYVKAAEALGVELDLLVVTPEPREAYRRITGEAWRVDDGQIPLGKGCVQDGANAVLLNTEMFVRLDDTVRLFVVAHELAHLWLRERRIYTLSPGPPDLAYVRDGLLDADVYHVDAFFDEYAANRLALSVCDRLTPRGARHFDTHRQEVVLAAFKAMNDSSLSRTLDALASATSPEVVDLAIGLCLSILRQAVDAFAILHHEKTRAHNAFARLNPTLAGLPLRQLLHGYETLYRQANWDASGYYGLVGRYLISAGIPGNAVERWRG